MNTTDCRYPTNNNDLQKEMALSVKQTNKQTWMNTTDCRYPTNNNDLEKGLASSDSTISSYFLRFQFNFTITCSLQAENDMI